MTAFHKRRLLLGRSAMIGALAISLFAAGGAAAQERNYNIPAESLSQALRDFGRVSGRQIIFTEQLVRGKRAPELKGGYSADAALAVLLNGTGLASQTNPSGAIMIVRGAQTQPDRAKWDADQTASIDEVVVTAQKREEKLIDVPMGVTALGGDTLARGRQLDLEDIAHSVRGLSLESKGPGTTRLVLRGLNSGGIGSTVAVYVDDTPFGSTTALANGGVLAGDFDPWDLSRVEVLSGPQGTLYGASSEGGLLKYVTNAPALGRYAGAVEVSDESIAHGQNGASVKGMINIPLGDKVAIRLVGYDETLPGYIDDSLLGIDGVNRGRKEGGRISVLLAPSENFSLRLTADAQNLKTGASTIVDVDPVTRKPVHGEFGQERYLRENFAFKYENYNATASLDFGWASLVSSTSYGVQNVDYPLDYTSVDAIGTTTYGEYLSAVFGQPLSMGLTQAVDLKKFTQEMRLVSPKSERLEWQVGAFYTHEKALIAQTFTGYVLGSDQPAAGVPNLETLTLDSTYSEVAGFANLTYHFTPRFDLQLGGRYSHNSQTALEQGDGYFFGFAPISFNADSKGDVFTYSVAPEWHVDANTMVYGRIASGYRPGGPNILPPLAPSDVPRQYDSDSTVNYEVGVRSTQFNGVISLDVDAFYITWKDIQLFEVVENTGVNGNAGSAVSQGVEWNIAAVPVAGLRLALNGAYTDAKLTSSTSAISGAVAGEPLPYAPKWSGALDAQYDWRAFGDYDAFVGANWSYVGERFSNFSSGAAQTKLPSYDRVDLRAGLQDSRWQVEVFVKNVADSRGLTAMTADPVAPDQAAGAYFTRPRTIGAAITARF